jgi:hypothetical protein
MDETELNPLLLIDIQRSWKFAVRALNNAENSGLKDTATNLIEVVAKLSQIYEFHLAQKVGFEKENGIRG